MSDEKQAKEVKDEELDKVSGGHGNSEMGRIHEDGRTHEDGAGGKQHVFGTGGNKVK